jgi:hypothetical protein
MRPDGYENAPPNIKKAFDDGVKHGQSSMVGKCRCATAVEVKAQYLFEDIMRGVDPRTLTVSLQYLEYLRSERGLR